MSASRTARRIVQRVVRWYPASFPRVLANDIVEVFAAEYETRLQGGRPQALVFLVRTGLALLVDTFRERLAGPPRRPMHKSRVGLRARFGAFAQDIRYSLRGIRRSPGFACAVIVSLTLGIGANTAIFGIVHSVLLDPTPYVDRDRVVFLELYSTRHAVFAAMRGDHVAELQRRSRSIERIEVASYQRVDWRRGDATEERHARYVTSRFPHATGMRLLAGRAFLPEEGDPGAEPVVLLGEGLWRNEFGRRLEVVGETVDLDGIPHVVVGIVHGQWRDRGVAFWIPRNLDPDGERSLVVLAWIAPGVELTEAKAELEVISKDFTLGPLGPVTVRAWRPGERVRGSWIGRTLYLFWGAISCVLLLVCTNLAGLLTARNFGRRRELAVCAALGAHPFRVLRQLLSESVILALIGGVGGLLLAAWGTDVLLALRPLSMAVVYPDHVPLNATVIAYGLGLALATGIVSGIGPARRAARLEVSAELRGIRDGSGSQPGARRFFQGIVGFQMALTLVLLLAAGLLLNSFMRLQDVDRGFDPHNLVVLGVALDPDDYPEPHERRDFFRRLADRVRRLDGVSAVTLSADAPPHDTLMIGQLEVEGRPTAEPPLVGAARGPVTSDYWDVLGIPILEGGPLPDEDTGTGDQPVVVSKSFARTLGLDRSPVGERFRLREDAPWMRVVGVAGEVAGRGLHDADGGQVYIPYEASAAIRSDVIVRTEVDPTLFMDVLRQQVWALDPDLPIDVIETMESRFARSISSERFNAMLVGLFSLVAVVLAGIGVFGVASYVARQRTHEIGLRIALGAAPARLLSLVVRQAIAPALAGIAAGLVCAWSASGLLGSLVYAISVTDPTTYFLAAALLSGVAFVAILGPAVRAIRSDPLDSLRAQ